jgi:hypothetical protein
MLEMCSDAQERCDQRIVAAREKNDHNTVAYQLQLKDQYESMKRNIIAETRGDATLGRYGMLDELIERIRRLSPLGDPPSDADRHRQEG